MATAQNLIDALSPLLKDLSKVDHQASDAEICLNGSWPVDGEYMESIRLLILQGIEKGWFAPRGEEGMKWGRLSKASEATYGYSIDGVIMNQSGPGHAHPNGELDLCFALEGQPVFDGKPEGWVIYGPNSWHVPTVTGGRMAILYFLPKGAIQFGPKSPDQ